MGDQECHMRNIKKILWFSRVCFCSNTMSHLYQDSYNLSIVSLYTILQYKTLFIHMIYLSLFSRPRERERFKFCFFSSSHLLATFSFALGLQLIIFLVLFKKMTLNLDRPENILKCYKRQIVMALCLTIIINKAFFLKKKKL